MAAYAAKEKHDRVYSVNNHSQKYIFINTNIKKLMEIISKKKTEYVKENIKWFNLVPISFRNMKRDVIISFFIEKKI